MSKGMTISFIIEGESANYGEGFGNITSLKKITRSDGQAYTYISRQALRYNIVEQLGWSNTPIQASGSGAKTVVQFHPEANIDKYPEIDLFGYMKTTRDENANTRSAVVRLSNAIAMEAYLGDMDFLTNMGLARRENLQNSIAQSEIHRTYYTYTIVADLDRVGVDKGAGIEIPNTEKAKRICDLLDTLKFLYRDIKGRRENLSPVFVIGGIYPRKNPFFENRLKMRKMVLDVELIKNVLNLDALIKDNTYMGCMEGGFLNSEEIIEEFKPLPIGDFFNTVKQKVEEYYA